MEHAEPRCAQAEPRFLFAELFAGIGGFRVALEAIGGVCCFACEYSRAAVATYTSNFPESRPVGDVRRIAAAQIPRHDVLVAGFPCQSFSNAGRLGLFEDANGSLFYELVRIVRLCRPRALLLENVRGLLTNPDVLQEVRRALAEAGYPELAIVCLDAALLLPQRRRRVYIVGFLQEGVGRHFTFPALPSLRRSADSILEYAHGTAAPPAAQLSLPAAKWAKVAASEYYLRFHGARLLAAGAIAQTLQTTYKSARARDSKWHLLLLLGCCCCVATLRRSACSSPVLAGLPALLAVCAAAVTAVAGAIRWRDGRRK